MQSQGHAFLPGRSTYHNASIDWFSNFFKLLKWAKLEFHSIEYIVSTTSKVSSTRGVWAEVWCPPGEDVEKVNHTSANAFWSDPWVPSNSVTLHVYNSLIRLDWIPWHCKILDLGTPECLSVNPVVTCSTPIPPSSSHAQSPIILLGLFGGGGGSNNLSDSPLLHPSWEAISQLSVYFFVTCISPKVISFYYSINKQNEHHCVSCYGIWNHMEYRTCKHIGSCPLMPKVWLERQNCHMF